MPYYVIREYNVGKEPKLVMVFDRESEIRRVAVFKTAKAAQEAALIIGMLRTDTAFEGTEVIRGDQI